MGTMRDTVPLFAVEGRAITGTPPFERAAPRRKSTCPPMPLYIALPIESEHTCPVRSTSMAELIATMRLFCAITNGSLA